MSTPTITPDQNIDPTQGASAPSVLSQTIAPQMLQYDPSQEQQMDAATSGPQAPPAGSSRLVSVLGAISKTLSTGLAGVPDRGRPSFAGGLGNGARANQAADAVAQEIKFKNFDDQVRTANLHVQDQELQNRTQAQQDAHQKAQEDRHEWLQSQGQDDDTIPNTGAAVTDYLKTQTTTNGAASIPAGTHLTADGKGIVVPQDTQATRDAQLKQYQTFGPALGLPALPEGAKFVPPKALDILTHSLQGYGVDGHPINPAELPGRITALQAQHDQLTASGAQPAAIKAVDNVMGIYKANLKADNDQAQQSAQSKKAGEVAAETSPAAIAGAGAKAGAVSNAEQANKLALQQNAQDVKPPKAQSTDWVPGVSADEKKKAELAENIAFNANEVAKIVMNRPDILGAVAGRYTNTQQMVGNNDPDISALGVHIHNMAMANSGVHGFRSQEGVESYEKQILNNFKNGPKAMAGALRASTGSVQTFIDNARPDTYKTHSKNGGAVTGMMQ